MRLVALSLFVLGCAAAPPEGAVHDGAPRYDETALHDGSDPRAPALGGARAIAAGTSAADEEKNASAPDEEATSGMGVHDAKGSAVVALEGLHKILAAPRWNADVVGIFRAGQSLAATAEPAGSVGCPGGWRAVVPRGFVCVDDRVTTDPSHPAVAALRLALPRDEALPFDYGVARGGPRYRRLPPDVHATDLPRALSAFFEARPGPVRAQGAYPGMKLAWATRLALGDRSWLLTPDMLLVPADEVDAPRMPTRQTRFDLAAHPLPFAVVVGPARRHRVEAGRAVAGEAIAEGTVVPLVDEARWSGGRTLWAARDGSLVGGALAIFRAHAPPRLAAPGEKWIHATVHGGALVAYEGSRPVFAALMSPGLGGTHPDHELRTPPGVYRVNAKWRTSDMGGPLPGGGSWRTREVPWVAYYDGSYAIHGAWWHDHFGRPRSHGCINLAPADAQWLFGWLEPALPAGWHAVRADERLPGTIVWITP